MAAMDGREDMSRTSPAAKLTHDDFLSFPDDGLRHELIDGEHYVTPSPSTKHQRVSRELLLELGNYLRAHAIGEVFGAPFDVVLSFHDVVEPDLLVVLSEQSEILTPTHVKGAPAILVAILSPGTRRIDERIKRALYDRVGVQEYWLVDPDRDEITSCRRSHAGALDVETRLARASGDLLTSPLLPEFSVQLGTLFR